jgi:hypothetical protein
MTGLKARPTNRCSPAARTDTLVLRVANALLRTENYSVRFSLTTEH